MEDENYTPRLKMVGKKTTFLFVLVVEHNYSKTRKVYEQKTAPTYKMICGRMLHKYIHTYIYTYIHCINN